MVDEANPPDTEVAPREALAPTDDACRTEGLDALPTSGDDLPGCAATPPGRETGCLPEDEMVGIDGCNEVAGDEVVLLERSVRAASQSLHCAVSLLMRGDLSTASEAGVAIPEERPAMAAPVPVGSSWRSTGWSKDDLTLSMKWGSST